MDGPLRIRRIRQTRRWRWRCASCLFQFAVRQPQRAPETGGHLRRVRGDEQRPPAANVRISSSTRACVSSSRCAVGSSSRISPGSRRNSRASATRCACPPDRPLPASAQHGIQAQRLTLGEFQDSRAPCGLAQRLVRGPWTAQADILAMVPAISCGWPISAIRPRSAASSQSASGRPSINISPSQGRRRAIASISEDLPMPLGPISATCSPGASASAAPSSTGAGRPGAIAQAARAH